MTREALYDEVSPYLAEERMGNLKRGGLRNIYLSVLVCSGLVGFTLLLIFVSRSLPHTAFQAFAGGFPRESVAVPADGHSFFISFDGAV